MKTPIRRTLATVALAALTAATLTACGDDEPAEFEAEQETVEQETEGSTGPATDDKEQTAGDEQAEDKATDEAEEGATSGTEPAGNALNTPDNAVETVTFEIPGADERDEATVTVGLHGLRVEGEVMVLELSFTPEFRNDDELSLYHMFGRRLMLPVLNDRENLKQYTVLGAVGGSDGWATSNSGRGPRVGSGQSLQYWAHFAAPEDDIDSIHVAFGLVEFADVAIER